MSKLNVLQVLIGKIKTDYNPAKDSNELNFIDKNKNILSDFGKEKSKVFKICIVENKELNYLVFIIDDKKIFLDTYGFDSKNMNEADTAGFIGSNYPYKKLFHTRG